MTTVTLIRRRTLLTLLALAAMLGLLAGCGQDTKDKNAGIESQKAEDVAWQAGADRPPSTRTLLAIARLLADQERDAEAEFVLKRVLTEEPRYLPAYVDLAEVQVRRGEMDAAVATLNEGLKISPDDPVLLNDIGMTYLMKDQPDQALNWFQKASALAPRNPRYRANVATALGLTGRYDESLSAYMQVVDPIDAHHNVAILARKRGDEARAMQEMTKIRLLEAVATTQPARR